MSEPGRTLDPIEAAAREMARGHVVDARRARGGGIRSRVAAIERVLTDVDRRLVAGVDLQPRHARAAEWLVDNAYVVREALQQATENVPSAYYRQLPRLAGDPWAGLPRVYALATSMVAEGRGPLDLDRVSRFVVAYQQVAALTMGELWALPTLLRLAVLEDLARHGALVAGTPIDHAVAARMPATPSTPVDETRIGSGIISLRTLASYDWKAFFERVSPLEALLRRDPAEVYAGMDFETRDRYRKAIEEIARWADGDELAVAREAVRLSLAAGADSARSRHVGFHLVDRGRAQLEVCLRCRAPWRTRVARRLRRHATPVYLGTVALATASALWVFARYGAAAGATTGQLAAIVGLTLVPATSLAVGLINGWITHAVAPSVLPKLDFAAGIPPECRTMVVVPALLTGARDVHSLLDHLEVNYLGNVDPNLSFALLTDLADAPQQHMPDDETLIDRVVAGIRALNARYADEAGQPFYLFHRERRWNPAENCWMGWERKRGKLAEFSRLLGGAQDTSYRVLIGDLDPLRAIRYVITLDADTLLPHSSAARLVATLAHPLNQAVFEPGSEHVAAGYTVVQPHIETMPTSVARTLFARVFAGEVGLDLYSHAVSDVYQDVFGEGVYVGKGVYEVASFERSLAGRTPENAILSHDLFEGIQGRAALASDLALFEDYPAQVLPYFGRLHRWIRGDWQLLPWLLPRVPAAGGGLVPNRLSLLSRWKLFDNLRRSLLAPSLLLLLLAGWLWLPGSAAVWTLCAVALLGTPILLGGLSAAHRVARGAPWRPVLADTTGSVRFDLARWLLALTFLPFEALIVVDAVARTLVRLTITRRHLLEWTPSADTRHSLITRNEVSQPSFAWRRMAAAPLMALAALALVGGVHQPAWWSALPILALWLVSPHIAYLVSRPVAPPAAAPALATDRRWRRLARRTWLYFERFVGPDDHWLPPDHFQEEPGGVIARRTSPTNLGLMMLSTLAAYDLGYLGPLGLAARIGNTFDTMRRLERYRGHFLNWYDTRDLTPLAPRYVSTVDSGNLAGCLVALADGLDSVARSPVLRPAQWEGLLDTIGVLSEAVAGLDAAEIPAVVDIGAHLAELRRAVARVGSGIDAWAMVLLDIGERRLPAIETRMAALVEAGTHEFGAQTVGDLRHWCDRLRHHTDLSLRELDRLAPWSLAIARPPALYGMTTLDPAVAGAWHDLLAVVADTPGLGQVPKFCRAAQARLAQLDDRVSAGGGAGALLEAARAWNGGLAAALDRAVESAAQTQAELHALASAARRTADDMEFGFLFNRSRRLLHLGYNISSGALDPNHYDLLASEARLASFLAIAKGDVPPSHWLHLGRPFILTAGSSVLLSWGGTAFEYFLPALLMHTPRHSLLDQSCRVAAKCHIAYARQHGIPWGVSESGFGRLDAHSNYQYRAFGVPGLGLRRDADPRLVVAPYASLLALPFDAPAVLANLDRLLAVGLLGHYGFYEAADFGRPRAQAVQRPEIVRSYMAHHQGMILVALDNLLHDGVMRRRFHADPRFATVELLLHEQIPHHVPLAIPAATRERAATPPRAPASVPSWPVPHDAPHPQTQLLSNGRYGVLITARGAGFSRWQGLALTRWRADPTTETLGSWIYVQDRDSGGLWSAGYEPTAIQPESYDARFAPHMAEFHRRDQGVSLRLRVTVPPGADIEVRHVVLTNETDRPRRLSLTSFGEVVLAPPADDRRHPAFNKLFIESTFLDAPGVLLFQRRARAAQEPPVYLAHAVVAASPAVGRPSCETDRARFLGRGGTAGRPAALAAGSVELSGTTGATLDPILALRVDIDLAPRTEVEVAFLTAAGPARADVLGALDAYGSLSQVHWAFEQARAQSEIHLYELGIASEQARHLQALLSMIVHPYAALRAAPEILAANRRSQRGLWARGLSGDIPIVLVRVRRIEDALLAEELLRAHAFWRRAQLEIDLVILDEHVTGYAQSLRDRLERVISATDGHVWLNGRGGIFLLGADRLEPADRTLLEATARVLLDSEHGALAAQLGRRWPAPHRLPNFVPMPSAPPRAEPTPALNRPAKLLFDNGLGGFSADGREYVIYLEPGRCTPAPWINVVANPDFGFLISETGGGYTWALNSGENRLSPWRNDPVSDLPGEALYLRDEETGEVWSPTPLPAGAPVAYQVRHGAGYSIFRHLSHGLEQELRLYAALDAPVKIIALQLTNRWDRNRRLTATYYVEWVLGTDRELTALHVVPEFDAACGALLARNAFSDAYGERVAFLAAALPPHGITADRGEFLGRGGLSRPAALDRIGLAGTVHAGIDPCAALQVHVELAPGETKTVHFVLGQGRDRSDALDLAGRFRNPQAAGSAWTALADWWDGLLGEIEVHTPDPAMDVLLNRWLLYQVLACRLWGRSALYQSSGAFGFRDQLQDVMALPAGAQRLARSHILEAARHQFDAGDVLHWWHPPSGAGVRTRCSDDLLWLPYVTAEYVSSSSDTSILKEVVPFLAGAPLAAGEIERYAHFEAATEAATLYEHCRRALDRGMTVGPHGLPLIGSGDWNDGLNRVGLAGRGESVWLGWFLYAALTRFAPLCELMGEGEHARLLREQAEALRRALEASAWDGEWYRRAYYDDGTALGSAEDTECKIDLIAQAWAVISGAAGRERAVQAMRAASERLVRDGDGLVMLLAPPFDRTINDPGYIKGYPPGIRENGGQYNHAAVWAAWAFAMLGDGDRAAGLFRLLGPISRSATPEAMERYRVEPYAVAADVYTAPPHTGRGGWTWYTGAAGWLYRLGLEAILGLRRAGGTLYIDPCIPTGWPGYDVTLREGTAIYRIHVDNPGGTSRGVAQVALDGELLAAPAIRLVDDGREHVVEVRLGGGRG